MPSGYYYNITGLFVCLFHSLPPHIQSHPQEPWYQAWMTQSIIAPIQLRSPATTPSRCFLLSGCFFDKNIMDKIACFFGCFFDSDVKTKGFYQKSCKVFPVCFKKPWETKKTEPRNLPAERAQKVGKMGLALCPGREQLKEPISGTSWNPSSKWKSVKSVRPLIWET